MPGRHFPSLRTAMRRQPLGRALARPPYAAHAKARAWRRSRAIREQRRLVIQEIGRGNVLERFVGREPLPPGYGTSVNERVVEIPWLLAQQLGGRVLDAGSALNHPEFLDLIQPRVRELHIVTLAYEGVAHVDRGISYLFSDLRHLPYADGYFDTVASISTLEHVGMDNVGYGADAPRADDPAKEMDLAIRELVRVLRPNGALLVTVPYGRREDHGSFRQLDRSDIERLVAAAAGGEAEISVYRYSNTGWLASDLESAADARYRPGFAAEAVACIRIT
jgi:SAM-dependent methyltransferase